MGDRVNLDAIQARANAATPGPWVLEDAIGTVMAHPQRPTPPDDQVFIAYARTDVPAMIAELRAARQFRDDIRAALNPGRGRGFDGPDGVSLAEVLDDVDAALTKFDASMSRWDTSGTCPNGGG